MKKMQNNLFGYENKHLNSGKVLIAGMDEAGRGPLAGPVVCACVIMPLDEVNIIDGVNDSKQLTEKKRSELYEQIVQTALAFSVVFANEKTIDEMNILNATKQAMVDCVNQLPITPQVVLIDAVKLNLPMESESIVHGDALSYSIACASIVAKVTRDRFMVEQDKLYPQYNFKQHKGYGTKEHIANLKQFGASDIHRKTFITHFVGK